MEQGVSLYIDPSGAQTGGRVVKREFQEIGQAAVTAQQRIDEMAQVTRRAAKSAQDSFQVMAQAQDALRAKYNPTFAVLQRYKQTQDEIRQAHRLGAISANEMSAAMSRERQAALSTIQAIKGHTGAIVADNAAVRMASFQRRNLIFQLNDVAVSLASGMNPLMVMAQQGSQIGQIYMGQGGVVTALRETAEMAGSAALRFGKWGMLLAPIALGLADIREQARNALHETVSWGEVATATFQTIRDGLRSALGPAVSTLMAPLFYAFDKLSSAAVDIAEKVINAFRAAGYDIAMIFDQLPNIVGAAFTGAVNIAIEKLNTLVKVSSDSVDSIIAAFNKIPGLNIPSIGASDQTIAPLSNPYLDALSKVVEQRNKKIEEIMSDTPIRDLGSSIVDRIGANRARSRFDDLANLDFGSSIQGANSLSTAVGSVATAGKQASSTIIDMNQQLKDSRRSTLATFEQSGSQLRNMKTELKQAQETLAAAAKTPVKDVFGWDVGSNAAGAIAAAASSIQKVFGALNEGRITAQTAHESLELIRASLHQLGGDTASVDLFIDKMIKGNLHVGELESSVKSLSASIAGIPNRTISIGIQQYTVPTAGGGTKGVNVYGGVADFSYQSYDVGGGKTVGVSGGNGNYSTYGGGGLVDPYDQAMMDLTLGYGGARAAGGPTDAGKTYLVGEKGPELLTMGGAGNVTNADSTASILSGGRDTLSLIEDHVYNTLQELRIHTNYFETYESDFTEMVACLKAVESGITSVAVAARSTASVSYGSSGGGSSRGGGGFGSGSGSQGSGGSPNYNSIYTGIGITYTNGTGAIGYGTYNISPSVIGTQRNPGLHGFATGGQIMPGEDQKVEFFKKNTERVIVVDDNKVLDGRSGAEGGQGKSERPINLHVNFNGGAALDQRSRQAQADEFRRVVQQVVRS
ncbi:phage tape measure domain-containing protein [Rhizobium sp. TAL182]|uniref:phage tail length tape measure family protein n=1 Tax=Rhizobium sp. TAL182 TaxID=2020313 RepID=UPI000A211400|nr:phage tail length tape measure family protein [Rhizobium sp. TAL182]ARO24738.1 phage tape measure domain-containing protein [Rhizobium sp. TAL182]